MSNAIIYQPQGKAREYCELALNLYKGCSHGCTYCYVPLFTKRDRQDFYKNVTPRKDIIEQLKKDVSPHVLLSKESNGGNAGIGGGKYAGKEVLLSFISDPYQPIERELHLTRKAIKILIDNGIRVNILTKAGMHSVKDFDILAQCNGNKYGATLTFIDRNDSLRYEPFAAVPLSRMSALNMAKAKGIETWASLEPVIDPAQSIELVEQTYKYVDTYKIGKCNYPRVLSPLLPCGSKDGGSGGKYIASNMKYIDWTRFLKDIIKVFKKHKKKYYIKKDLAKYLQPPHLAPSSCSHC